MDMGVPEVKAFLSYLTNERHVSVSTHKQALCALLFLYKQVLESDFPWLDGVYRTNRPPRLSTVLTEWEVSAIFAEMKSTHALMARLLYGAGMRLMECITLRGKDVDFGRREITIREGKDNKNRITMLPIALVVPLREQIECARAVYDEDRAGGRSVGHHATAPDRWEQLLPTQSHPTSLIFRKPSIALPPFVSPYVVMCCYPAQYCVLPTPTTKEPPDAK